MTDKVNNNQRHVYNVNDFLRIDDLKCKLAQYFTHTYRRRRYDFLVCYIMTSLIKISENNDEVYHMNSVLNLSVHDQKKAQQHVYDLSALQHESLYMINISSEPE